MPASLGDLARSCAEIHPDRPAFLADEAQLTYSELDSWSDAVAGGLSSSGVAPGDRIGYLGRNHLGYPVIAVAASKLGAISLGLNWRLAAGELAGVLADSRPHTVFADAEFVGTARAAAAALDGEHPVIIEIAEDTADQARLTSLTSSWAESTAPPARAGVADDIASLIYTSGTTGRPKGVMTSNAALLGHLSVEMPWAFDGSTVALIAAPVFHAVGSIWTAMTVHGAAAGVLLADPDPARVLAVLERRRVTHAMIVPALLQALLAHPDRPSRDLSALQVIVYGASPIAERVLEQAQECLPGCRLVQGYGMTETTGPVTFLWPDEHVTGSPLLRTAGRAAPNCEVRVIDMVTAQPSAPGEPGEVQARSPQLCSGYWNNAEESAALFDADGWLRTGDIGVLDADGYLTLTDRVKDVIVTGGENVYSGEVERVLLMIPELTDACVVGRPDERWGEAVTAVVVAREPIEADAVIAFCRERMAHYKCPNVVRFVDELPKNPAGKTLRRVVRDTLRT